MNTDAPTVLRAFEDHLVTLVPTDKLHDADVFTLVWGDDVDALGSLERERALMVMPRLGPEPERGGGRCREMIEGVITGRWPVSREGRDRMVADVIDLREHARGAPARVDGLVRVSFPSAPSYSYRVFEGVNTALAHIPFRLSYHVPVGS